MVATVVGSATTMTITRRARSISSRLGRQVWICGAPGRVFLSLAYVRGSRLLAVVAGNEILVGI